MEITPEDMEIIEDFYGHYRNSQTIDEKIGLLVSLPALGMGRIPFFGSEEEKIEYLRNLEDAYIIFTKMEF